MTTKLTPVSPREDHEVLPLPGSAYTTEGYNAGLSASLLNPLHYPVEAICGGGCGQVIRCEKFLPGADGGAFVHAGRMAGQP